MKNLLPVTLIFDRRYDIIRGFLFWVFYRLSLVTMWLDDDRLEQLMRGSL